MTVNEFALNLLRSHGCDEYTYGGRESENLMHDLKKAFPCGTDFPLLDIANAILAVSRPRPIVRKPYRVLWDSEDCTDADGGHDTFDEAKETALDIYANWIAEATAEWKKSELNDAEKDDFDWMIYNCGAIVEKYNPDTDEYEDFWCPSEEELNEIGWKPFNNN